MTDLRHALRGLVRAPWYAATVITVMALGLALASTVFAVVDGVLFNPLPYARVHELFGVSPTNARSAQQAARLRPASIPDLRAWRAAAPDVLFGSFNTSGGKLTLASEDVEFAQVDATFFDALGQRPLIGGFQPDHFGPPGSVEPVLISFALWQRAFGGDMTVVGRTFPNPTQPGESPSSTQVVGILPGDFLFPSPGGIFRPQVLLPMAPPSSEAAARPGANFLYMIARLPAGVPVSGVEEALVVAASEVAKLYPPPQPGRRAAEPFDAVHLVPIRKALTGRTRTSFTVTFLSAAALLLLACVNLTGLAGARMQDRQQELALRRALGASHSDLLRLIGMETTVVVFTGGALGLLLATPLLTAIQALLPGYLLLKTPAIDGRVVAFCALASAVSVAIVTAWPAGSVRGASLRVSLAATGTTTQRRSRGVAVVIAAQVGIGLALVLAATLFIASLGKVWQEEPGVRTDGAYRLELTTKGAQDVATINRLIANVRRVPGVVAAGGLAHGFLQQVFNGSVFDAPLDVDDSGIESLPVTAGFLDAAGLDAVDGRLPSHEELERGAPVIAVSVRAAKRLWPRERAIGQTLLQRGRPFDVVGVVPDVRYRSLDVEPQGEIYWPLAASPEPFLWNLYVRIQPGADDAMQSILRGLAAQFPAYQVVNVQTAAQSYGQALRQRRFQAWLFGSFGFASLVVVGVGIFGMLATITSRRTREIGIRLALGGTRERIIGLLLREQLASVAAGVVLGAAVSFWGVQFVRTSLYGLTGYDPHIWLAAAAVIILTAGLGTLVPALRVTRTEPTEALRVH